MKYSRQLLVACGIGGALLALLLSDCALPFGRPETPAPPVVAPPVKAEVPTAEGPKVEQVGKASWYGPAQNGKETASGETFDQNKLTAASPTLPMGTKAKVTNLETGKSVDVTINDRGPYTKGRKIDLSRAAARQIGMSEKGVARVKIETRRHRKPTTKRARPATTKRRRKPTKKRARRTTTSGTTAGATRPDTPVLSPQ